MLPGSAALPVPQWPTAQVPIGRATFKSQPADFTVLERPLPAAQMARAGSHNGCAHRLFEIRKTGLNTQTVAQLLARWAAVPAVEIGYAGRKDRWAVTQQWFSLPASACRGDGDATLEFERFAQAQVPAGGSLQVVGQAWQPRKLKIGDLAGNDFCIRLMLHSALSELDLQSALERLQLEGVPNYFGPQRFGRENLPKALAWLQQRVQEHSDSARSTADQHRSNRRRSGRSRRDGERSVASWHVSTLRSYLFNQILAARVRAGQHGQMLAGDVLLDGIPTGPLWGRGRSATDALAGQIETRALTPFTDVLHGLEHTGVAQMRRPLVVFAQNLSQRRDGSQLEFRFSLPRGAYATTVLAEFFQLDSQAPTTTEVAA